MRGIVTAIAACVLLGACGGETPVQVGATFTPGPQSPAVPTAGPGVPEASPTTQGPAPAPAPTKHVISTLAQLRQELVNAIHFKKRRGDPSLRVERRKYAQYQLIINWQVSDDARDPLAKQLAAYDASRILKHIQASSLPPFGSVLLLISARVRGPGGSTLTTQVVRAKYTDAAVRGQKFSTGKVWTQTDDKPATVHPQFR